MMTSTQQRLLGAFLRAHRERLPRPAGAGTRRRTPGLTREELAVAAGLSNTWLTWLEQGRALNVSVAVLVRLADTLKLSPAERASMLDLAGKRDPNPPAPMAADLPAELLDVPSGFTYPAYLLDSVWTVRAWNRPAADLLWEGQLPNSAEPLNLLAWHFLRPPIASVSREEWDDRGARMVAEFRADFNRRPDDRAMGELVAKLVEQSTLFAEFWHSQDVRNREGGTRWYPHPEGSVQFRQTTLMFTERPEVKLVCLVPVVQD